MKDVIIFSSFYEAYNRAIQENMCDIWVIGGSNIYNTALRHFGCNKIYLTEIQGTFETDTSIQLENYNIEWKNSICKIDINRFDNVEYHLVFKEGYIKKNIENQYLECLYDVLHNGEKKQTRNAITYSKFNRTLIHNLEDGFPLITTKKMFWKGIVEELLFFIRGDTDTNTLFNKGVKIWEGNTTKEFIQKMGLPYESGIMGPMYGYQWRYFNKPYLHNNVNDENVGVDQLRKIIKELREDPNSRRILMTTFNPAQVSEGVLYPCHSIVIQFQVSNQNKLNCTMYTRSSDLLLGIPFNIASTALLVHIIAKLTNKIAGMLNIVLGDYHIYEDHYDAVIKQLNRTPYDFPKLNMSNFGCLEDVEKSKLDDYKLDGYNSHDTIKAKMIA
jgi:thymidylate synthase